ncbi:MAG: exodeoxyribonuclease VII large subunit [Cytophagales bacterium]|nr:exodeoxyribonuclease VII large subunit [Cytophagales bacterium]
MEHISLYELNKTIGAVLAKNLEPSYWVVAEIGEIKTNQKGHCYLELVEKENNIIKAKTRATIWSYTYRNLSTWFQGITGQSLKAGMKILFNAAVQYHEVYGFSLNIRDIDARYTLGERAKKRQEIIAQLRDDGIFEMNKELQLPVVPQRIAIISSETAAGFGDFKDQLHRNEFGYHFNLKLFNSIMQGDQAEASILSSMHQVFEKIDDFDLLIIIRGGGASLDLDCFDSYDICSHIAQFPVPVITGIGHERDETIADMVAHTKLKTPTAVAEFIISGFRNFELKLNDCFDRLVGKLQQRLNQEATSLDQYVFRFRNAAQRKLYDRQNLVNRLLNALNYNRHQVLNKQAGTLDGFSRQLSRYPNRYIQAQQSRLDHLKKELSALDPENVLSRGYSITLIHGKNVDKIHEIGEDASITTITRNLEIKSKYQSSKIRN